MIQQQIVFREYLRFALICLCNYYKGIHADYLHVLVKEDCISGSVNNPGVNRVISDEVTLKDTREK